MLKTAGEKLAARDENQLQGFFNAADLNRLLAQENCVGIRLYNVREKEKEDRRLIAVGITSEGDEINQPLTDQKYILSEKAGSNGQSVQKMTRSEAKATVEASEKSNLLNPAIFFASYFSQTMIQTLLNPLKNGPEIAGIRFYIVTRAFEIAGGVTHCGAATVVNEGVLSVPNRARHIVSDQPCPGFCSVEPEKIIELEATAAAIPTEESSRVALPPGVALFPAKDTEKYLVTW